MDGTMTQYKQRDVRALDSNGGHYCRHVAAMTEEGLFAKSDIAAELAWRDARIAELEAMLPKELLQQVSERTSSLKTQGAA